MFYSRKRAMSIAAAIAVAASLFSAPQAAMATPLCTFSGGDGSGISPYLVANRADLEEVALCDGVNKYFFQTVDISLTGTPWTAMGAFTGKYDGGGKAITGIEISTGTGNLGLFSTSATAEFSNLTLAGSVNRPTANTVGLLVGSASATSFHDIRVAATIFGHNTLGSLVGTLAGSSTVARVSSTSEVSGNTDVGGIVGSLGWTPSTVSRSTFAGSITTGGNGGGIAGRSDYGSFADVYSTGTVVITGTGAVGGIVGAQVEGSVSNSYSTMIIDTTISGGRGSLVGSAWRVNTSPTQLRSFGLAPMALSGTSEGDVPVSTSQAVAPAALLDIATFTASSWDIGTSLADNKIWTICAYANGGRPFLTFQALTCAAPVVAPVVPSTPVVVYIPSATVTGQSLKLADLKGGEIVTIFGTNLDLLKTVFVDGTSVDVSDFNESSVTFNLPTHLPGAVNVLILTKNTHLTFIEAITYVDKTPVIKVATVKAPVKKPAKKPVKKPVKKVIKKTK